jgi:Fur family ferric uptake transcriptional regulator
MLRDTKQRRAIRQVFEVAGRPLRPEEVLEAAQGQVEGLGIATVYRAIKTFCEEGWLDTVELPGCPARYELSGKAHHHHFHCRQCGKVFELEGCLEEIRKLAPRGFRLTGHEIVLYGFCIGCRQ